MGALYGPPLGASPPPWRHTLGDMPLGWDARAEETSQDIMFLDASPSWVQGLLAALTLVLAFVQLDFTLLGTGAACLTRLARRGSWGRHLRARRSSDAGTGAEVRHLTHRSATATWRSTPLVDTRPQAPRGGCQ